MHLAGRFSFAGRVQGEVSRRVDRGDDLALRPPRGAALQLLRRREQRTAAAAVCLDTVLYFNGCFGPCPLARSWPISDCLSKFSCQVDNLCALMGGLCPGTGDLTPNASVGEIPFSQFFRIRKVNNNLGSSAQFISPLAQRIL